MPSHSFSAMPSLRLYLAFFTVSISFLASACDAPSHPDVSPTYKYVEKDKAKGSSGERGNMLISEIHYAGSVKGDTMESRYWDPDDVFIELWNKNPRPINLSGWRIEIEGDVESAHRIPPTSKAVPPNGFFVIAAKKDGAFGEKADVIIPELKLGKNLVYISLRDMDRKRMEDAGSDREIAFAGGYDTVSARSMERAQIIFGNRGEKGTNWHAYSENVGGNNIKKEYRKYTLASPGESNSPDYSGNASAGNYE